MDSRKPRRSLEFSLLLLIMVACFSLRMAFLHEPLERDEGQYAYIGQEILRGGIPYVNAIEIKPPGAFYIYAAGMAIFGQTPEGIRIFTALYALITTFFVYLTARVISGAWGGLLAGLLFALFSGAPLLQGSSSNTEVFMLLPLIASIYFFIVSIDSGRRLHTGLSGFFAGLALLIKPVALPYGLLLLGVLLFKWKGSRRHSLTTELASFVLPPLFLGALTVAYFAARGALEQFLYWNLGFHLSGKYGLIAGPPFSKMVSYLGWELGPLAIIAVPTAMWLIAGKFDLAHKVLALFLPIALVGVWLPGKFFPHYFIQLVPILAVLATVGLVRLWGAFRPAAIAAVSLLVVLTVVAAYKESLYYAKLTPQEVSYAKYGPDFVSSEIIGQYLKSRTAPDDYIFQWGFEPELYFLADRRAPEGHVVNMLIYFDKDPKQALDGLLQALEAKKPRYIVYQPEWAETYGHDQIKQIIYRDYVQEIRLAYAYIYRRVR